MGKLLRGLLTGDEMGVPVLTGVEGLENRESPTFIGTNFLGLVMGDDEELAVWLSNPSTMDLLGTKFFEELTGEDIGLTFIDLGVRVSVLWVVLREVGVSPSQSVSEDEANTGVDEGASSFPFFPLSSSSVSFRAVG